MYTQKIKEGHIPTKRNKTGRKSPIKGKKLEDIYGIEKAEEIKTKLSQQKIGKLNPVKKEEVKLKISNTAKLNYKNGNRKISNNNSIKKGGKRLDLNNQYFRSGWEADFARTLKLENIEYQYENKVQLLNDITYFPDFYLPQFNIYFEIKANNGDTKKYELFKNEYPNEIIYLIKGNEFKFLSKIYSYKIKNWESKKYYFERYNKKSIESSETICWTLFMEYLNNEDIAQS